MFRRLLERFGSPQAAFEATQTGAARTAGFPVPRPTVKRQPPELLDRALQWLDTIPDHHSLFWIGHPDYPPLLADIAEPPPVLFCRGTPSLLHQMPTLAVVGARQASPTGRAFARAIAGWAAQHGIAIVSGGARGIDAEAHQACLAQGGKTIAAIATGIDVVYPPEHASLFDDLARSGCLVTEFFPGTPPVASHFPTRNRIIAGLAQAVIFIEGAARSGGLITVQRALQADRPVWAARHPDLLAGAQPGLEKRLASDRFFSAPDEIFPLLQKLFKPRRRRKSAS